MAQISSRQHRANLEAKHSADDGLRLSTRRCLFYTSLGRTNPGKSMLCRRPTQERPTPIALLPQELLADILLVSLHGTPILMWTRTLTSYRAFRNFQVLEASGCTGTPIRDFFTSFKQRLRAPLLESLELLGDFKPRDVAEIRLFDAPHLTRLRLCRVHPPWTWTGFSITKSLCLGSSSGIWQLDLEQVVQCFRICHALENLRLEYVHFRQNHLFALPTKPCLPRMRNLEFYFAEDDSLYPFLSSIALPQLVSLAYISRYKDWKSMSELAESAMQDLTQPLLQDSPKIRIDIAMQADATIYRYIKAGADVLTVKMTNSLPWKTTFQVLDLLFLELPFSNFARVTLELCDAGWTLDEIRKVGDVSQQLNCTHLRITNDVTTAMTSTGSILRRRSPTEEDPEPLWAFAVLEVVELPEVDSEQADITTMMELQAVLEDRRRRMPVSWEAICGTVRRTECTAASSDGQGRRLDESIARRYTNEMPVPFR